MSKQSKRNGNPVIPADATTVVTFVLDETGSMEAIKNDTIGGFNAFLRSLQDQRQGRVEFTLVKFDSNGIDKVHVAEDVRHVARLTDDTYRPGAMTPLIDAAYISIKATEKALEPRRDDPAVLCVIQTDGEENASTRHSLAELRRLIGAKREDGWQFVFLGAGIDAFDAAESMGIHADGTLPYARAASADAFDVLAEATDEFRAAGGRGGLRFNRSQRRRAGGGKADDGRGGEPSDDLSFVG